MGKCGYVYQASNFLYGGQYFTQVYEINGEKVHPRATKKLLKKSNMEWTRIYPKDHNLKWFDKTSKPKFEIEQPHFTYEEVLHNARNISGGGASLRGIL